MNTEQNDVILQIVKAYPARPNQPARDFYQVVNRATNSVDEFLTRDAAVLFGTTLAEQRSVAFRDEDARICICDFTPAEVT
jgi:hypothetical protein